MEQHIDSNPEQAASPSEQKVEKSPRVIDRITLGVVESERVIGWLNQLGEGSAGFLDLTKSDVVNFLIREHKIDLTLKEIKSIRSAHYDPIRHINWITPRLKEALAKSDMVQVAILQSEIKSIELSLISKISPIHKSSSIPSKPPRKKRKSIDTIEGEVNADT